VFQQRVAFGRVIDRHMQDRTLTRRQYLAEQKLSAICRPAAGQHIEGLGGPCEQPLVAAGAIR
jgi:hypothetical protein